MDASVIPELVVADAPAGRRLLAGVFGFEPFGALMRRGDQSIALREGRAEGHGVIDHLALSVPDVQTIAAEMVARGARPDATTTPDGPRRIAEFWDGGVEYLFLQGPEGTRIELCCNLAAPKPVGHDHVGIPCSDIDLTLAFVTAAGGRLLSSVALLRPEGQTAVRFVALGASVLELYAPPAPANLARAAHWSRLLVPGLTAAQAGPDGLVLAPMPPA